MKKPTALLLLAAMGAACSGPEPYARPDLVRKGELAPKLALAGLLNAPSGELKNLEELKGKVIVLDFWATWCGPCVENISRFNALADKFSNKPVVFIFVTDEDRYAVSEFLKKTPIKGWVAPEVPAEAFRAYRVFDRPHTVLIGRDSKTVAVTVPQEVTEERLNMLLAGQAPEIGGSGKNFSGVKRGTAAVIAEFYLGEPVSGEMTSEYGPDFYGGHNVPLTAALACFYRDILKIDASGKGLEKMEKRYELRVRLAGGRGADLRDFFAAGIERALGLRVKEVKKDVQVYLLKPALGGPKGFIRSKAVKSSYRMEGGDLIAEMMPVGTLCDALKRRLDLPLLDETGLKGEYDYTFRRGANELAGINTDLMGQLGLRLLKATRRSAVLEVSER